jgi:hypothetical protein
MSGCLKCTLLAYIYIYTRMCINSIACDVTKKCLIFFILQYDIPILNMIYGTFCDFHKVTGLILQGCFNQIRYFYTYIPPLP